MRDILPIIAIAVSFFALGFNTCNLIWQYRKDDL